MQKLNGDIVAIAVEKLPSFGEGLKRHPGLPCLFACDPEAEAVSSMKLIQENLAKIGKRVAIPANILVDRNGIIRWTHFAQLIMDRPDRELVAQKVFELSL